MGSFSISMVGVATYPDSYWSCLLLLGPKKSNTWLVFWSLPTRCHCWNVTWKDWWETWVIRGFHSWLVPFDVAVVDVDVTQSFHLQWSKQRYMGGRMWRTWWLVEFAKVSAHVGNHAFCLGTANNSLQHHDIQTLSSHSPDLEAGKLSCTSTVW